MEKYIKDWLVAVLYSPWYWAWWYTWNKEYWEQLIFDKRIVEKVLNKEKIDEEWIKWILNLNDIYMGWLDDLEVEWIPEWTNFRIDEYDWNESIVTEEQLYFTA